MFKSNSAPKTTPVSKSTNRADKVQQQRQPAQVQTKLKVGQPDDAYEQEADRVAYQVVNGSGIANTSTQKPSSSHVQTKPLLTAPANQIQRYVFISGTQVDKTIRQPNTTMQAWTADTDIRDYTGTDEFERHSKGKTEHIGVLKTGKSPGTWVRFVEKEMNILGEDHLKVTLKDVMPAVGSAKFVRERFITDDLSSTPLTEAHYEKGAEDDYKTLGIDSDPDKRQYGGESLFPKIGYVLIGLIPALKPSMVDHLKSGTYPSGNPKYSGKPYQRYLKLAWIWSAENMVAFDKGVPEAMTTARSNLAAKHKTLKPQLAPFFASLPLDGYLGDALDTPAYATLYAPLKEFSETFLEVVYEMIYDDSSNPLPSAQKDKLKPGSGSTTTEKEDVLKELRNINLYNAVKKGAANGKFYAGMGWRHLKYFTPARTPSNWHIFNMNTTHLARFEAHTAHLKSIAK